MALINIYGIIMIIFGPLKKKIYIYIYIYIYILIFSMNAVFHVKINAFKIPFLKQSSAIWWE